MESQFELTPFLDRITSQQVAPAGGSATAAVGAIAASVAEMATIHTLRSEEPHDTSRLVKGQRTLAAKRSLLVGLATADGRVVESAFGGSSDLTQPVRKRLVAVPLAIAEVCLDVVSEARDLVPVVTQRLTQDLQTAIALVSGALQAALQTARYNLGLLEGPEAERLSTRVAEVAESAETATK